MHPRSKSKKRSLARNLGLFFAVAYFTLLTVSLAFSDEDAAKAEKAARWKKNFAEKIVPILESRCANCHRGEKVEGEFDISKFVDGEAALAANDTWDRVARRIRLNEMPPQGSPGLDDTQKGDFHRWVDNRPNQDLCKQLASDETQSWYRGHVMSRRLTQTEYRNAIRDLVGVPLLPGEEPPSDGAGGEGFDTVGDALFTSTIHLEAYLSIASRVMDAALPDNAINLNGMQRTIADHLLSAKPTSLSSESALGESDAARKCVEGFANRAWRRPVSSDEVERLMRLFESAKQHGHGFIAALREPLKAILVSPHFLFVVELEATEAGVQRLTPYQLATRLALFIWSSTPDDQLLRLAQSGELYEESVLRAQVQRMLDDPRSRAIGENFGLQWLGLRSFASVKPDSSVFPEFDDRTADEMREEAIRTVAGIFQLNRPLTDLIAMNFVVVNGHLARHYGIELPEDAPWQVVETKDGIRGGVITMGSVLTTTSYPRRTSPVLRGRWVLEELLGAPVPPPPPNVPPLEESPSNTENMTLRQRLELHRTKAECASCHDRMDPLGFGLENFDGIGRWRDNDNGAPIDAAGKLPSGDTFSGPRELKSILMNRRGEFQQHFIRKLLCFALGRELNKFDACIVETCSKQLEKNELRSRILIEEIALSYPFQYRYYKPSEPLPPAAEKGAIAPRVKKFFIALPEKSKMQLAKPRSRAIKQIEPEFAPIQPETLTSSTPQEPN